MYEKVGTVPSDLGRVELVLDLRRALEGLPNAAELVVAVAIDEEQVQDVGLRLGMSVESASELDRRALERLKARFAAIVP